MSTRTPGTSWSAGPGLAAGEHWIELVPAAHAEPHQISFPAAIEHRRHHGLWVRPRLRREVAEAICEWLNLVYPADPDWYPLARFEDDLLIMFTGEAAHQRHEIPPERDGRYPLGEIGRWFLSGPTRTRDHLFHRLAVLRDAERHTQLPGETLVTCDPDNLPVTAFPARIDTGGSSGWVPVFRPEIAEAVVVWCALNHDSFPKDHPQVYFDGDTLVHVHQHLRARDGYQPWRIDPDANGNYRIDRGEWTFQAVSDKSEGGVPPAASA
ncbi:hypothetical protein [Amycolatopsis magusensis]|uniref:Uncharacterized protein n=1 Tax=Amycolatopsis magusensis TaxID=882444 RepID=A0ABS4PWE5_9PSEU|nr:hypothetical protein [Amycolatopsis magusensis]MBP2182906.1 hypothetical protein [Amycolatopsis magusensis]